MNVSRKESIASKLVKSQCKVCHVSFCCKASIDFANCSMLMKQINRKNKRESIQNDFFLIEMKTAHTWKWLFKEIVLKTKELSLLFWAEQFQRLTGKYFTRQCEVKASYVDRNEKTWNANLMTYSKTTMATNRNSHTLLWNVFNQGNGKWIARNF